MITALGVLIGLAIVVVIAGAWWFFLKYDEIIFMIFICLFVLGLCGGLVWACVMMGIDIAKGWFR